MAMKRRSRKRSLKAASHPQIPRDAPQISSNAPQTPRDVEKPTGGSVAPAGADRRTHPRYQFTAAIEIVGATSGVRIYCQLSKGMGLVFTAIESQQLPTLEAWLTESRETSWLAANRRRSQRVLMKIPVRVSGQNALGSPFEEETQTLAVSAHGALISVSTKVKKGQRLALLNVQTKAALECVVAHIRQGDPLQVGVEFTLPNPTFWRVAFPPKDWTPRHPDAKSSVKGSA
jgi:PilZ domain